MSDLALALPDRRLPARARRVVRLAPLWLIVSLVALSGLVVGLRQNQYGPLIQSDGLGYYAWTEAILHHDFDFCQWQPLHTVGAISARNPAHAGRCENKFSPALALLRFPVMAPVALATDHESNQTLNVSDAEGEASLLCGVLALLAAALLMWGTLRRLGVTTRTAQLTVLALVFGTGLFSYATFDASFSDAYSAALFAGLIYAGVSASQHRRRPRALLVFGLSLFIAWIRLPDILPLVLLVAVWIGHETRPLSGRSRRLTAALRLAVPTVLAVVLVVAFQVLYSRWSAGVWTLSSYGGEPFSLTQGDEIKVLFGADHGLFTWYPVLALMLIVGFWRRRSRPWAWLAAVAIALLTIVYGSWDPWFLGDAMGMRGMVDIVPVIAVAAGIGFADLPRRLRTLTLALGLVLTLVTVELLIGYWTGTIPRAGNTGAQYWHQIVGQPSRGQS